MLLFCRQNFYYHLDKLRNICITEMLFGELQKYIFVGLDKEALPY